MTWWSRLTHELRTLILGPYTTGDPALARIFGGAPTVSGEPVTVARAASLTAVWSCVNLIAGSIATMPLLLYRRVDEDRERAVEHPLYDVLRTRPNPVQSVVSFWESMTVALLLRGNAFATITRDDDARPRALWYVNPDRVQIDVTKAGRLKYRVTNPDGTQTTIPADGMLHICGPMSDDGYCGRSVISTFRETLGLGLALERYGAEFFSNAATPKGVLTAPNRLSREAQERLVATLEDRHGSPGRRHRTMVLEEGVKFEPVGVSHEDSQFVDVRRFTTEEIARIFSVPASMIGAETKGSLTYSNAETRALDFLKFCLGPWLARIEAACNFSLVSPLERRQLYVEFLPDALLATDTAGRYAAYKTGLESGFLTVEEVRRRENLPALPERIPQVG